LQAVAGWRLHGASPWPAVRAAVFRWRGHAVTAAKQAGQKCTETFRVVRVLRGQKNKSHRPED